MKFTKIIMEIAVELIILLFSFFIIYNVYLVNKQVEYIKLTDILLFATVGLIGIFCISVNLYIRVKNAKENYIN